MTIVYYPDGKEQADCGKTGKRKAGQATVEYAIVAGVLVALVAVMSLLLATFGDYGERILEMIASDYP